jgi:Terpene cyclase DEP1
MTSLLIHAALGLFCAVLFFYFNSHLYRSGWSGSRVSALEALYYFIAIGSVLVGWYFNVKYVQAFPEQAGWVHFTKMLFTNPAAGSGSQDLITTNLFLFPLWTIIDGPRRGLKRTWIYFVLSLFTSFGFAMGLYLAAQERQVRWLKSSAPQSR